ncbi:MAG: aminotransferase class I/II-fold pyridoxal phosphate-dependent enzyme, partial [Armatimonadota bacterium]|nr:aminotransferase class I/II-fold pyridoxal phosphate-dependent enzyme [Armatimonadota bacterium]
VICGVSEAIMAAILTLTEAGDEVVIFEPRHEDYVPDCLIAGVCRRFVLLSRPEYRSEPAALPRAITPRTRVVILNAAHKPTGRVFTRGELEVVAGICHRHGRVGGGSRYVSFNCAKKAATLREAATRLTCLGAGRGR